MLAPSLLAWAGWLTVHCRMGNDGPWVATLMSLEVVRGLLWESMCTCIYIYITKHTCKFIERTYLHIFRTTVIRFTSTRYSSVSKALYQIIVQNEVIINDAMYFLNVCTYGGR